METLSQSQASIRQSAHERLRDIVSVDVVNGLHSPIGQGDLFSSRQSQENRRIEVPGRIDGHPTRSDDMSRMQDGNRKPGAAGFVEQILLNGRLLAPIL